MSRFTIDQALAIAVEQHQAGRLAQAETMYRQILSVAPDHFDALNLLGLLALQSGQSDAAVQLLQRAVAVSPRSYDAHFNLGTAYQAQSKLNEALVSYQRAIEINPPSAPCHSNIGSVLLMQGKLEEAAASFTLATAFGPNIAGLHCNLGRVLLNLKRFDEAINSFRRAIELDPRCIQNHLDLANAFEAKGAWSEAIEHLRLTLELEPQSAKVMNNLANLLLAQGESEKADTLYRRALQLDPGNVVLHDNFLLALQYSPSNDPQAIFDEHRRWNQNHALPLKRLIIPHDNDRAPEQLLRIGYVSPDFSMHSVAYFALPLIESHDREKFHVTCYSNRMVEDDITRRFKSGASEWRNISALSDDSAAKMIRDDKIDILVDLAGHTTMNRLPLFARRPAPIQVTYLGYPATTGLDAIDYRFTDEHADPTGVTDRWCSEMLIRLPDTAWCFTPLSGSPEIGPLPAKTNGFVTFGSFNNNAKLSGMLIEIWARLFRELPSSRLLIKNPAMKSETAQDILLKKFAQHGVGKDRLIIVPPETSAQDHLKWYNRVDIALDSFPYHGTTTTCEASWMGVPTVTLAGDTHVSRVGVSLLSTLGLTDLIAQTPEQYVAIARQLAADILALSALRSELRQRMSDSVQMNGKKFARNVEAAYRKMWLERDRLTGRLSASS